MAKQSAQDILRNYEQLHNLTIEAALREVEALYDGATWQISLLAALQSYKEGEGKFTLSQYPALKKKVDDTIKKLHADLSVTITDGISTSWGNSNKKNNKLLDIRFADSSPSKRAKQILYDPNLRALNAFITRKDKGLNLSDRIWNSLEPFKMELEAGLALGIKEGQSARAMAKDLKKYQIDPDRLYRRVRDAEGELQLSKKAREYHPGQGVYRSSFKNALRLTATETNISYRYSDNLRWQTMPFVIGIDIQTSDQHPKYDICDKCRGRYPKDFLFKGWHPNCMCYQTPVMLSNKEYSKYEDSILGIGDAPGIQQVITVPAGFNEFIRENQKRIKNWSSPPYWFTDNSKYVKKAIQINKTKLPVDYSVLKLTPYIQNLQAAKYKDVFPELSTEEKASINGYTDNEYWRLNSYLRGLNVSADTAAYLNAYRNLLNNALDAISKPYEGIAYRGSTLDAAALSVYKTALKEGSEVTHDYFTSSSYDAGSQFSGNTKFIIYSKNGRVIEPISFHDHEKEVLFKAGTKFKVKKIKKTGSITFITLEEI
jgi:hypothetical protein